MENTKEFPIFIRRKIPYVSEGLFGIVITALIIFLLLYLFMMPAKKAPTEMAAAYYILAVPDWIKKASIAALAILTVSIPLYVAARLKRRAILSQTLDALIIKGKQIDLKIPFSRIKRVYFNDLKDLLRKPKGKMQIVIQQKNDTSIHFLLVNYSDADSALSALAMLTNAEFAFYEDNMISTHDDE